VTNSKFKCKSKMKPNTTFNDQIYLNCLIFIETKRVRKEVKMSRILNQNIIFPNLIASFVSNA